MLIIPWWIWHSFGRIEFFPFSCWPVFLDEHTKSFPIDCWKPFSCISHYPCFAVSPFSCSVLIDLSVDLWACLLAITFPCRFFFLGSVIHIAFPYLPHCWRFSVYYVGKSPTMRLFECALGDKDFRSMDIVWPSAPASILLTPSPHLELFVAVSLRWYRLWHLAAGVGFCFYTPFPLSARSPAHRWDLMNGCQGKPISVRT